MRYRLTYNAGSVNHPLVTEWDDKTLDQLLVPNGQESLLVWMLREADARGTSFRLESIDHAGP